MPNWVYNNVQVSGTTKDLLAFADKARQPHESLWITEEWRWDAETGKNVKVPENERKIEPKVEQPDAISFWNFIRPTDEELPYYFGHKTKPEDEADPNATSEERMAKALTFSGSGWYDWNVRNWGTKWDANEDEVDGLDELPADQNEQSDLSYRFSTAWGIPEEVLRAMVEQHPELSFYIECEEEQGWGAIYESNEGELTLTKQWDIPDSHSAHEELGRECWACMDGNQDEMYDDCPDKNKEFEVVVREVYRVKAMNAEDAVELIRSTRKTEFHTEDAEKAHFVEETLSAREPEDTDELIDLDA